MNMLRPYLSDTLVQALGWTFLHSLWVGALLSVIFLGVRWIMKSYSAQSKYVAGLSFLSLLPAIMLLIFVYTFNELAHVSPSSTPEMEVGTTQLAEFTTGAADVVSQTAEVPFYVGWLDEIRTYYFYKYHSFLVTVWLIGVALLSAQNIGGYFYSGRLRKQGLLEPGEELIKAFNSLLKASGVSKGVLLMESLLVKAPVLVGYFKPVILLPIGLASSLSASEVEAILAHEIAHIRRHDFLVNILQCCVEVLFFYHPGVWVIGSAIRSERENCCDDIAVRLSGNSMSLALALTHVEEWKLTSNVALGFSGNRNSLLNRIKRIINDKTMKAQNRDGNLLAIAIIAGLCLSTLTALKGIDYEMVQEIPAQEEVAQEPIEVEPAIEMTEPVQSEEPFVVAEVEPVEEREATVAVVVSADTLIQGEAAPLPALAPVSDRASMLPLPGTPPLPPMDAVLQAGSPDMYSLAAPRARWSYSQSADRVWEAAATGSDTVVWDAPAPADTREFAMHMQDMAREMAHMQEHMAREMAERAVEMSKAAENMSLHHEEMASEMARHQQEMAEEMAERHREMAEKHALMAQEFGEKHQEEMLKHQEEMMNEQKKMFAIQQTEMKKMEAEMRLHEEKMKVFEKELRSELVKDGIISLKDDHFKLRINGKELTVNGDRQSAEMYKKYRKLIQEKFGDGYTFDEDSNEEMNMSFSF
ncbi:M56 family metallopeptidase [Imperialibacter roseus]|uniref:M56 family metallopeptidase n=1 Tax=Imperialibacter roseus TaxID=1324217 RepID=A0ABZ0IQX6_9BACT|nr:M56 family metallopeptidase [Imperialibacter roseus]WOK07399.1 M56 family metallopeptidase [Imperialibacter roseus]